MDKYVAECIQIYNAQNLKQFKTPVGGNLFDHNTADEQATLSEEDSECSRHTTAKLFFAAKRMCIDIDL